MSKLTACLVVVIVGLGSYQTVRGHIGPNSTIPPVVLYPNPEAEDRDYRIYVEEILGGPMVGAEVKLVFPPEACDLLILCDYDYDDCGRTYVDTTDVNGEAIFAICGGGCWNEDAVGPYLVQVLVNGDLEAEVGVRSPDVVEAPSPNKKSWELWCSSPPSAPGAAIAAVHDAVFMTFYWANGINYPCADLDGDGRARLSDIILATPAYRLGTICQETGQ